MFKNETLTKIFRNTFKMTVFNSITERSNKNIAVKYYTIFYQNLMRILSMKYS